MKEIVIAVNNKIASVRLGGAVVNGNSDVRVRFELDSDWDSVGVKTAVFVMSDGCTFYRVLTDNACTAPAFYNTAYVKIGVTGGDIHTSTPAVVACRACIKDEAGSEPPVNEDMYEALCTLIDRRVPETAQAGRVLATGKDGAGEWIPLDNISGGYSKAETDRLLSARAYKRTLNTTASGTVELSDIDDYRLQNVNSLRFSINAASESNITLTTADTGSISVRFAGARAYSGDDVTLMGNGETWVFNVKNSCLSGKRWN